MKKSDVVTARKTWKNPEIIVLKRSETKRAVIASCKMLWDLGPDSYYSNCQTMFYCHENCESLAKS